jgi:hypothetical protein
VIRSIFYFLLFFCLNKIPAQDTIRFFADSVKVDSVEVTWKVTHPEMVDSFVVEHYRWQKWVKAGVAKPDNATHVYYFKISWHYGENKVRIAFYRDGKARHSQPIKFNHPNAPDCCDPVYRVYDSLQLGAPYSYEVFDKLGNVVRKGHGSSIYVKDLKPDVYYLSYNNKIMEFIRKKKK